MHLSMRFKGRKSSFGSLTSFENTIGLLNDDNLKSLSKAGVIESLTLPLLKNSELVLLPFSAKVDHRDYTISAASLSHADVPTLNILVRKLFLAIVHQTSTLPAAPVLSFLRYIADLGHFVELKVCFFHSGSGCWDIPDAAVQEIIRATLANCSLKVLDLSTHVKLVNWNTHVGTLLEGINDHKELRT